MNRWRDAGRERDGGTGIDGEIDGGMDRRMDSVEAAFASLHAVNVQLL